MEFVDQPRAQKSSVCPAPSLQQEPPHAEFAAEDVKSEGEVDLRISRENVRHALAAQARQVRVRDPLGKNDHDRITADVRAAPADPALGVQYHAVRLRVAL
jgi:hypothetical protein